MPTALRYWLRCRSCSHQRSIRWLLAEPGRKDALVMKAKENKGLLLCNGTKHTKATVYAERRSKGMEGDLQRDDALILVKLPSLPHKESPRIARHTQTIPPAPCRAPSTTQGGGESCTWTPFPIAQGFTGYTLCYRTICLPERESNIINEVTSSGTATGLL